MSKKVPLYLCDKKRECNGPCYRECRLTHDIDHAVRDDEGDYWATFGAETGWFVDWCCWYHGRWVVWLGDIPNDVSNAIAWCKPMEPYKGVTT